MGSLAREIEALRVPSGALAIYWLCQAGFIFKDSTGRVVAIDPYFSDIVEKRFGFARMMQCPLTAGELDADLLVCTHEHLDHMDTDALPEIARNKHTQFAGPIECYKTFLELGVPPERCHLIREGVSAVIAGVMVHGVFADHGPSTPDALGIVLEFDRTRVYHTGDTCYRPDKFDAAIKLRPDILIPCINGRFGKLNATEAAQLCRDANPSLCIASHFWMFVAHNGDPGLFLDGCRRLSPGTETLVMKPGLLKLFQAQERNNLPS